MQLDAELEAAIKQFLAGAEQQLSSPRSSIDGLTHAQNKTSKDEPRKRSASFQDVCAQAGNTSAAVIRRLAPFGVQVAVSAAAYSSGLGLFQLLGWGLRISCNTRVLSSCLGCLGVGFSSALAGHMSRHVQRQMDQGTFSMAVWQGFDPEEALLDALVALTAFKACRGAFSSIMPADLRHPGPWGFTSLPVSGSAAESGERYAQGSARQQLEAIFARDGCHHCGSKRGPIIGDHQPPTKLFNDMRAAASSSASAAAQQPNVLRNMVDQVKGMLGGQLTPSAVEKIRQRYYAQCGRCSLLQSQVVRNGSRQNPLLIHWRLWHLTPPGFLPGIAAGLRPSPRDVWAEPPPPHHASGGKAKRAARNRLFGRNSHAATSHQHAYHQQQALQQLSLQHAAVAAALASSGAQAQARRAHGNNWWLTASIYDNGASLPMLLPAAGDDGVAADQRMLLPCSQMLLQQAQQQQQGAAMLLQQHGVGRSGYARGARLMSVVDDDSSDDDGDYSDNEHCGYGSYAGGKDALGVKDVSTMMGRSSHARNAGIWAWSQRMDEVPGTDMFSPPTDVTLGANTMAPPLSSSSSQQRQQQQQQQPFNTSSTRTVVTTTTTTTTSNDPQAPPPSSSLLLSKGPAPAAAQQQYWGDQGNNMHTTLTLQKQQPVSSTDGSGHAPPPHVHSSHKWLLNSSCPSSDTSLKSLAQGMHSSQASTPHAAQQHPLAPPPLVLPGHHAAPANHPTAFSTAPAPPPLAMSKGAASKGSSNSLVAAAMQQQPNAPSHVLGVKRPHAESPLHPGMDMQVMQLGSAHGFGSSNDKDMHAPDKDVPLGSHQKLQRHNGTSPAHHHQSSVHPSPAIHPIVVRSPAASPPASIRSPGGRVQVHSFPISWPLAIPA